MINDPLFYAVAIPAIILVGISKGGFGGPLGMLGVPILSLAISPVQAAAILLPILVSMDMIGLYAYRGKADWMVLKAMLPFAMLGIGLGWLLAGNVDEHFIRLLVGLTAIAFVLNYAWRTITKRQIATHGPASAAAWGATAGFTSFIAHAGGPPFQIHTLPLGLHRVTFAATAVYFFLDSQCGQTHSLFRIGAILDTESHHHPRAASHSPLGNAARHLSGQTRRPRGILPPVLSGNVPDIP